MFSDNLLQIFQGLLRNDDVGLATVVYFFLYSYIIFFVTCVQNVFIMIIQTGYASARDKIYGNCQHLVLDQVRVSSVFMHNLSENT